MIRTCQGAAISARRVWPEPLRGALLPGAGWWRFWARLRVYAACDVVGVRGARELRLADLVLGEEEVDRPVQSEQALAQHEAWHHEERRRSWRIGTDQRVDVGELREHAEQQAEEDDPGQQLEHPAATTRCVPRCGGVRGGAALKLNRKIVYSSLRNGKTSVRLLTTRGIVGCVFIALDWRLSEHRGVIVAHWRAERGHDKDGHPALARPPPDACRRGRGCRHGGRGSFALGEYLVDRKGERAGFPPAPRVRLAT